MNLFVLIRLFFSTQHKKTLYHSIPWLTAFCNSYSCGMCDNFLFEPPGNFNKLKFGRFWSKSVCCRIQNLLHLLVRADVLSNLLWLRGNLTHLKRVPLFGWISVRVEIICSTHLYLVSSQYWLCLTLTTASIHVVAIVVSRFLLVCNELRLWFCRLFWVYPQKVFFLNCVNGKRWWCYTVRQENTLWKLSVFSRDVRAEHVR